MTEEKPKGQQMKIGMVLVDNPEAKEVYLYLVQVDENDKAVSSLGVPAKIAFKYLTDYQSKFMDLAKPVETSQKGMVV
jgi:hypothetical protein